MNPFVALAMLAWFIQATLQQPNDGDLHYIDPVRGANEDEIKNLPGLTASINFKQYSGYLRADDKEKTEKFHHYWFVESQSDPVNDPVLLWLNGGPGCSSLLGLFTELGPFRINRDGMTLALNKYSWNKVANVIFLESPTETGFSYTTNSSYQHNDDSTAQENYLALKSFMRKFPQFQKNSLYMAGESYAGVYLSTLGVLVDKDAELNLKGIAIGNGYLDRLKSTIASVFFDYFHGLIANSLWNKLSTACCGDRPVSRETCTFSGPKVTPECIQIEQDYVPKVGNLNPFNLYAKCLTSSMNSDYAKIGDLKSSLHLNRRIVSRLLWAGAFSNNNLQSTSMLTSNLFQRLKFTPICMDDHLLIEYLNRKDVREALHIPDEVRTWNECSLIDYIEQYAILDDGVAPQMRELLASDSNLTLLIYNGDVDMTCNPVGNRWFVDDLGRDRIGDYSMWDIDQQAAGFVQHYDGITYATIRGAGHMVPADKPLEALALIEAFLTSTGHNVPSKTWTHLIGTNH